MYRFDGLGEFGAVFLVDVAGVAPEIQQAMLPGLISAEADLFVDSFVFSSAIHQVLESDVFGV